MPITGQVASARRSLGDMLATGRESGFAPLQHESLIVLIADDDESARALLQAMIEAQGHRVVSASSGAEAVSAFMREKPDLVLMDVMMPGIDGYQATEHMRELSGEAFVPVIFVTAPEDDASLSRCITSGGSDFLVKPFSHEVLKAKIDGFAQLRRILRTVKTQRDEMAGHNRWLKHEYQVAEAVFAKVMHSDALNAPNIKYLVSPQAVFNGDIVLAAYRPSGELHVMVGDFTGHGLSAAIGAIPVADIFHGMTAKGFAVPEIVAEMNQKLRRALPPGLFLAAALIELDAKGRRLSVWNGGVPDVIVTRGDRGEVSARLGSRNFPLAVVETGQLDCTLESVDIEPGQHIYLYTDGLTEMRDAAGEMFGEARLDACFGRAGDGLPTYDRILNDLQEFRERTAQSDDVTLIQIIVDDTLSSGQTIAASPAQVPRAASLWSVSFSFGVDTLKGYDPLPMMLGVLLDTQRLHQHKQRIYMVLAELFMNALEHGLLGLDSAIKAGPNGFSEYYKEKERRLAETRQGTVQVELKHAAIDPGGQLVIRVQDSGPGFDFKEKQQVTDNPPNGGPASGQGYFGRGISLVRSFCESLSYQGNGNCVEAVYVWNPDGPAEK
jgi:CheY-like chemotaxis protein/anti-sigma regulatory factor (Ser/Thr protein kinase)